MTSRSRLTAKQWSAELDKMIGWGAPVPPEHKAALLAYLTRSFSEMVPPPPLDAASPDELLAEDATLARRPSPEGDAARGGPLYTQHCATCHGPTGQGGDLGPRLAGRPVLLDDARYHEAVRKGLRRMPGFAAVLKPEGEVDLLAWLRAASDAPGP
jgi:ubiquinol-cytochrome c reductase cytochrome c subunit